MSVHVLKLDDSGFEAWTELGGDTFFGFGETHSDAVRDLQTQIPQRLSGYLDHAEPDLPLSAAEHLSYELQIRDEEDE